MYREMKILVNTPDINALGGVSNHYLGLKPYWNANVKYNNIGSKRIRKWLTPFSLIKYIYYLIVFRPDVVILNPSLGNGALIRDFFYMKLALAFGKKVAIFIHGFNLEYAAKIDKKWVVKNLNKASMIFVLANRFKKIMQGWGVLPPICLTTTKVDDNLIKGFDIKRDKDFSNRNILCLTRIEKAKGIYEAIDTYAILKQKYNDLTLTFVGDGSELESLKAYTNKKNLSDVRFTGKLSGTELSKEYQNADFFLFLSYGEGMPTVVLEAMAFGLPVFTRKVGGLVDFFENGKMGYITDSLFAQDFANAMIPYIENRELSQKVALYNAQYAKDHFMASRVARAIEHELSKIL